MEAALAFAEALAPEHLQLAGAAAEALAPRVRTAGCLFVGNESGTAFGDYVAGSNHTLPTEGAARFATGLNVRHFRRRMAEVRIGGAAPSWPPRRACRSPTPNASRSTPPRWQAARARILARELSYRLDRPQDGGDRRLPDARPVRDRRGHARDRRRLLRPHARPARPPRPAGPRGARERRPAHRRPPHRGGHRDRARPGPRPRARRPARDLPLRPRGRADGRGARDVRDRHLRPPVHAGHRLRAAPRREINGFDHEEAEEFFRAVARPRV